MAVQAMIAAANQINETPYIWGGGHGSWVSSGYDCSGAVSYVLHAAGLLDSPLTSGSLASWGESGSGSGPRWHTEGAYPSGYSVRHPAGY